MKDIKTLLKPYNIHKNKLRLGNKDPQKREYDGGYIVTEYETNICTALYSYGIGEDITADRDFYNLTKKPCYLYDHTIDGSVVSNSGLPLTFKREGLGFTPGCNDFLNHYKENGTEGEVILKIDVEGAEYKYLNEVDLESLESKVVSLLIEFHSLDHSHVVEAFEAVVNKLDKYFVLHHIHCNNYGNITNGIPSVPELSFINRRHISNISEDKSIYPIKGLDYPNTYQYNDIQLDFSDGNLKASYIKPSSDIPPPPQTIPNKFHFVFGLKEQTEEFHLIHYLCLKSCLEVNNPEVINFYYKNEPYGPYWDEIKPYLNLIQVDPPTEIFGIPVTHYAHQADIIRLQALIEEGGIYADMDTLFVNPYPKELLTKEFVMGKQGEEGLCNALMMSTPYSYFAQKWLLDHKICFKGGAQGSDGWCTHSVYYPLHLSKQIPSNIHIEDTTSFFNYLYHPTPLKTLFEDNQKVPDNVYSLHLWENVSWDSYIGGLTEEYIKNTNTTFTNLVKKLI